MAQLKKEHGAHVYVLAYLPAYFAWRLFGYVNAHLCLPYLSLSVVVVLLSVVVVALSNPPLVRRNISLPAVGMFLLLPCLVSTTLFTRIASILDSIYAIFTYVHTVLAM